MIGTDYIQMITPIITTIAMPILLLVLTRHSAKSDRDRLELLNLMHIQNAKLDAHILWHMGTSKNEAP